MNKAELLADVLEYMEQHLNDNITTACYCSRSTLEKLFRYVNHMSIREYLVRRRLTRAARDIMSEPDSGEKEYADSLVEKIRSGNHGYGKEKL